MIEMNYEMCNCSGMATDNYHIWYVTNINNFLMQVDIKTGETKFLGKIPGTNNVNMAYRTLIYNDNVLFIIPFYAQSLVKYYLDTGKFEIINIHPSFLEKKGIYLMLFGGHINNNKIVMYGVNGCILKYDYIHDVFSFNGPKEFSINFGCGISFWDSGFTNDIYNYYPIDSYRAIIVENLDIQSYFLIKWGEFDKKNYTITNFYNNKICCAIIDDNWNLKIELVDIVGTNNYESLLSVQIPNISHFNTNNPPFMCGNIIKDELILYPGYYHKMWIVNLKTASIKVIDDFPSYTNIRYCFNSITIDNTKGCSIFAREKKLVIYDYNNKTLSSLNMYLDSKSEEAIKNEVFDLSNSPIIDEQSSIITLREFINRIKTHNS